MGEFTRIGLESILNRNKLRESIERNNPEQLDIELGIYELLFSSSNSYEGRSLQELRNHIGSVIDTFVETEDRETTINRSIPLFYSWKGEYGHGPAYIVGLNFGAEEEHQTHIAGGEILFQGNDLFDIDKEFQNYLLELGYKDGAILLGCDGELVYSRALLENISPVDVPPAYEVAEGESYFRRFGFMEWVNKRHFSALGASYHLKGLIVYTLSEESGNIRRYQNGRITFSTNVAEQGLIDNLSSLS